MTDSVRLQIDDRNWDVPDSDDAVFLDKNHRFALVIPVINEGDRIRGQLARIKEADLPVDVVVADGGSTDGSLDPAFVQSAGVRAVLTKTGPGKLSAQLRMAYAWCLRQGYEGIVTIDGNGKDGVEAVAEFVTRLDEGYDYVQGSRYRRGGEAENTPLERTLGNRLIHAPMLSLAGRRMYTDTTNGFRAYSARYLLDKRVAPFRDVFMQYELLFYLTARAGQIGMRCCEVPVRRSYPASGKTPTKITGTGAKAALLMQTIKAALGHFDPRPKQRAAPETMPARRGVALFLGMTALLALQYIFNPLGIVPAHTFENWQTNGQARVLGGIVADVYGLDKQGAQMGRVYRASSEVPGLEPEFWMVPDTFELFDTRPTDEPILFEPYYAQFGLLQVALSQVATRTGLDTVAELQALIALLTAASIAAMTLLYQRLFGWGMAIPFLLTLAFAPYFVTMARNIYWAPFLFFLPSLAAGWVMLSRSLVLRLAALTLVVLAMFFKSASNYEYITSVTLLACAPLLAAPLFGRINDRRMMIGWAAAVFAACVVGFFAAFLLHASDRGETLIDGIRSIYVEDISRRTYGDADRFADETAQSLDASVLDVLKIYFYEEYPGRREMLLPGKVFLALIGLCVIGLGFKVATRHRHFRRDLLVFATYLAVPVSWFVFAKGHSYTQTHINFVLWYIGFIPALFFVSASSLSPIWSLVRTGRLDQSR